MAAKQGQIVPYICSKFGIHNTQDVFARISPTQQNHATITAFLKSQQTAAVMTSQPRIYLIDHMPTSLQDACKRPVNPINHKHPHTSTTPPKLKITPSHNRSVSQKLSNLSKIIQFVQFIQQVKTKLRIF